MSTLNIKEYLLSKDFLNDYEKKFDCIIIDADEFNIQGKIMKESLSQKNLCIVLNKTNLVDVLPVLDYLNHKKNQIITIINTNSGISSYGQKSLPEINDYGYAMSIGLSIFEPIDFADFQHIVDLPSNKYIRIPNKEVSAKIFESEIIYDTTLPIPLANGSQATILTTGTMIEEMGPIIETKLFDIFVMKNPMTIDAPGLLRSIEYTKKCYIIYDQQAGSIYEKIFSTLITTESDISPITFTFICPDYEAITTIHQEYVYEQIGFDGRGLLTKIQ